MLATPLVGLGFSWSVEIPDGSHHKVVSKMEKLLTQKYVQWNPDFSNLLRKRKLVRIIEGFEKSGVKLQCLTGEGKSVVVRIIGIFEKLRVQEIGIVLYMYSPKFLHTFLMKQVRRICLNIKTSYPW